MIKSLVEGPGQRASPGAAAPPMGNSKRSSGIDPFSLDGRPVGGDILQKCFFGPQVN
jgi:hypothetical protein